MMMCEKCLNEEFQTFLKSSKISDYDNLEDILNSLAWEQLKENLLNHKGFNCCYKVCGKNNEINIRKEVLPDGKISTQIQ